MGSLVKRRRKFWSKSKSSGFSGELKKGGKEQRED